MKITIKTAIILALAFCGAVMTADAQSLRGVAIAPEADKGPVVNGAVGAAASDGHPGTY